MLRRFEVGLLPHVRDVVGERVARKIKSELSIAVDRVRLVRVYTVEGLAPGLLDRVAASQSLHDPVLHVIADQPLARDFDWVIEVGFRPGVTDNEGRTARETLALALGLAPARGPGGAHRQRASGQRPDPAPRVQVRGPVARQARVRGPGRPGHGQGLRGGGRGAAVLHERRGAGRLQPGQHPGPVPGGDARHPELLRRSGRGRGPRRPRAPGRAHGRRGGGPGPDLERALQAQDLHRAHRLRGPRDRPPRDRGQPVQDLHPGQHRGHPPGQGQGRPLPLGVQGQRRRDQILGRPVHLHQGRDPQQPLGPGPVRRGAHRHRGREPRPHGHGPGRQPAVQHRRVLLRLAVLAGRAAAPAAPSAPGPGGRARGRGARRQQVRHPHGERLHRVRGALPGQAPGLLRHRGLPADHGHGPPQP